MVSLIQYYPFLEKFGGACNVNSLDDEMNERFMEFVRASDPGHASIVIRFVNEDWRDIDVIRRCKDMLAVMCK